VRIKPGAVSLSGEARIEWSTSAGCRKVAGHDRTAPVRQTWASAAAGFTGDRHVLRRCCTERAQRFEFSNGNTWEGRLSDYRVTTVGQPEFGPLIDAKVEATGTFHVERHQDRGYYDSILDDLRFGFTPGNVHGETHDESYGLRTRTTCAQPRIAVGDTTECRVTFAAPTEEMQDFRWWLNGSSIAAWPGQTTD